MTAEDVLIDNGYEDVTIFNGYSYDTALIGVADDGEYQRAVYDFDKMVDWLIQRGVDEDDAIDHITDNTIGSINPGDRNMPIIMYPLVRPDDDNIDTLIDNSNISPSSEEEMFKFVDSYTF